MTPWLRHGTRNTPTIGPDPAGSIRISRLLFPIRTTRPTLVNMQLRPGRRLRFWRICFQPTPKPSSPRLTQRASHGRWRAYSTPLTFKQDSTWATPSPPAAERDPDPRGPAPFSREPYQQAHVT